MRKNACKNKKVNMSKTHYSATFLAWFSSAESKPFRNSIQNIADELGKFVSKDTSIDLEALARQLTNNAPKWDGKMGMGHNLGSMMRSAAREVRFACASSAASLKAA